jgi:hypothetical protein
METSKRSLIVSYVSLHIINFPYFFLCIPLQSYMLPNDASMLTFIFVSYEKQVEILNCKFTYSQQNIINAQKTDTIHYWIVGG